MGFARSALVCRFLRSMMSAHDIEHMSDGSAHAHNDYRSYEAGLVTNFFPDATHSTRPVRAVARAQTPTPRGSHAA